MAPLGASRNTFRDLNVPYEGHEEYETPRADLLFPPLGNYANTKEAKVEELIKESGAKVIVSEAGVGQMALQFCNRNEIMVLKIASQFELDCFCRTSDAVPLVSIQYFA
ncbi:T-complex protein 1 subunit theta-like protein [Tanacetum coccineum]